MHLSSLVPSSSLLLLLLSPLSLAASAPSTPHLDLKRSPSHSLVRRDLPVHLTRREFPPFDNPYLILTEDFQLTPGKSYRINITTTVSVEEIAFLSLIRDPATGEEDYQEEMMLQAGLGEWLDEAIVDFEWPVGADPDVAMERTGHFGVTFSALEAAGAADVWETDLSGPSDGESSGSEGSGSGMRRRRRRRREVVGKLSR